MLTKTTQALYQYNNIADVYPKYHTLYVGYKLLSSCAEY